MPEPPVYLFAVSLVATLVLGAAALPLARRWNVVDLPGPRKIHSGPVPLAGGWAIFGGLTILLWGHSAVGLAIAGSEFATKLPASARYFLELAPQLAPKLAVFWGGAAVVFLLGLIDDARGLSVRARFAVEVAVAVGLVALGVRPDLGFLPAWVAAALGVVWIVGLINAFNFLDGLDGLATGVAFIATAALFAVTSIHRQPVVSALLATLAGTQLGFLRYNWHPARAFLGSSGSLLLGYLLAVSTLLVDFMVTRDNWFIPIFAPLFILALPIYDTTSVVLIRLIKGRSIAQGDQSHFHHRLLKVGFSHRQAVLFLYLIAFAVAVSAVLLVQTTPGQSALILLQIGATLTLLVMAERVAHRNGEKTP